MEKPRCETGLLQKLKLENGKRERGNWAQTLFPAFLIVKLKSEIMMPALREKIVVVKDCGLRLRPQCESNL